MEKCRDVVRVICSECRIEHMNNIYYGLIDKYPDDLVIECKICDNAEEGSWPIHSFEVIENYGRYELE